MISRTGTLLVCLLMAALPAQTAIAAKAKPAIPDAQAALKAHIERDTKILSKPMNNLNTRKTRAKLKDGFGKLKFVINEIKKGMGGKGEWAASELERIVAEEEREAAFARMTNRFKRNLKNTIKKNLAVKKAVLKAMHDGLVW